MLTLEQQTELSNALAGLDGQGLDALRRSWQRLHKVVPPASLSRDLLIRGIAYKLQEAAHGGLRPVARRRLAAWQDDRDAGGVPSAAAASPQFKPGAVLLRTWHGRTYRVEVTEEGFCFEDAIYPSLSLIARQITGAHWSGPRFFGLRRNSAVPTQGDA